ncbi:anti-sigma factor [Arthrobacter sp. AFG7.2]|uniref:anti-sigma factor n=1 Tax=Arthrobacter sp. AFG7.2 TaxID=1688693 RepID=UPI000C9E7E56|nr:anti-sigma factor [Arthrobacter sp. AFG7.2]PNI08256.1 anti-sigma factor [Arthrobacter sp. AFG7.2]
MPHPDPEELSLLALYEDWEDGDSREHLRVCPECAADFAALRRTVDAVRTTPDARLLEAPGPQVWAGIHCELGLSEAVQEDPLSGLEGQQAAERESLAEPVQLQGRTVSRPEQRRGATGPAARRAAAWWQRPGPWMAAAAAAVLVTAGAVWSLNQAPRPLAEADLAPLAQYSAAGSAKVVESADGARALEVRLSKDEAQGYQEVWLIASDLSRLVSLGVMNSDSGTFQLPAGLELSDYPIVDVSDEPVDGNPAHSSVSIARGTLNT